MPRESCKDTSRVGACGAQWRTKQRPDRGVRQSKPRLCWRCLWDRCADTPHPVRTTKLRGSPGTQRHIQIHVLSLPNQPSLTMSVISHRNMDTEQTHTHNAIHVNEKSYLQSKPLNLCHSPNNKRQQLIKSVYAICIKSSTAEVICNCPVCILHGKHKVYSNLYSIVQFSSTETRISYYSCQKAFLSPLEVTSYSLSVAYNVS